MTRTLAVLGALLALAATVAVVARWTPAPSQRPDVAAVQTPVSRPRPNVVVVLVDALRRDHVGAHGYHLPTTPFVDELSRRGVTFDNAWSHAPQTFNSTAALLTAQLFPLLLARPAAAPAGSQTTPLHALAAENQTLAELLYESGYDTLAVFTNPHHDEGSGFAQGFRLWRYLRPSRPDRVYARARDVEEAFRELASGLDPERPFFAYVHYMDVHNPYQPPPRVAERFVRTQGTDRYTNGRPEGDAVPSDDDLRFMMESYDACIRHVDESLREIAGLLDGLSRGRGTVLVVTADHGDEFMEHGGLGHGHSMHQELLRVPLVAAGGPLPQGVRVRSMARGVDVTATVADLAGLPVPATFEGLSLLPRVAAAEREEAMEPAPVEPAEVRVRLEDEHAFSFAWNAHLRGLTTEHLHLLADTHLGTREMYDVRADPHGRQDLFREVGRPARRMRRKMEEYERRLIESERRTATLARAGELAPAVAERSVEQLRALGYVE